MSTSVLVLFNVHYRHAAMQNRGSDPRDKVGRATLQPYLAVILKFYNPAVAA
jgi:hypothetical protein